MNTLWFRLLVLSLSLSLTPVAFSGEKGGSGINGEQEIVLENFKLYRECPEIRAKNLCLEIDRKMQLPSWEAKRSQKDEQLQEEFFFSCCFTPDKR